MTVFPTHSLERKQKGVLRGLAGSKIWQYLTEDVREDVLVDIELLALSFATGIQDATTYPDYLCFASNQTGNTVFLTIGVAGLVGDSFNFSNIGISLGMFVAGGWIMGQTGNYFGVRKRLWLIISNVIQTSMVYAAMVIQYVLPIQSEGSVALGVIALLAFSSGGQVAMGRSLKITEITTAMATAAYVDLVVDPNLVKLINRSRNRRLLFLLMLTAGCFAGAYAHSAVNSAFAVLLSAVVKTLVTVAFFFNKSMLRNDQALEPS